MPIESVQALVEALQETRLLQPEQLREFTRSLYTRYKDPHALAMELVRRHWLTVYQVDGLFQDYGQELVVGPYRVLDSLGEGEIGQVFKAWDTRRNHIVALKVIRSELLSHPEAFGRFQREIKVIAQLSHPNIVRRYDAHLEGDLHYFAMEFVDGVTLQRLVEQSGPLPVAEACRYVRQVALGLQHIHERGLIHRDIKPGNLLVTKARTLVKILDLGLARRYRAPGEADSGHNLTKEGVALGTPDFLAPEQARRPRTVDIRADIYSLGCTLYFLLAGRPPFPGRSLMQKLLDHQQRVPAPIEFLRPDVPRELTDVVSKMMAKRPVDRHQFPAEVAADLAVLR